VWKIDRLVRRAKHYRRVLDVLEESGVASRIRCKSQRA
jgi:DNA invertase Pin-like site-specific DNA recombinase